MTTVIKKASRRKSVALQDLPCGSWFEYNNRLYFFPESGEYEAFVAVVVVDFSQGQLVQMTADAKVLPVTSVTLEIQP